MMKKEITRIREFRKGKFTQKEMASLLNLSERQYRRIEKNDCKPDIWSAIKIANALGVQDLREIWVQKDLQEIWAQSVRTDIITG